MSPETHARSWWWAHMVSLIVFPAQAVVTGVLLLIKFDFTSRNAMLLAGSLIIAAMLAAIALAHVAFRFLLRPVCPGCSGSMSVKSLNPVIYACRGCGLKQHTKVRILFPEIGESNLAGFD